MMKVWLTSLRNVVVGGHQQHVSSNMIKVSCFSYVSHNNEHNLGAPPPRSPPKVNLSVDDPKDDPFNKKRTTLDDDDNRDRSTTEDVADKAKRGTKGVVETAFSTGAALAEGMEKSWGGIKETTEKLKDSVLGNDDHDENNEKRYGSNYRGDDKGYVDKNIEDLRRKAHGYDQKSH